MKSLVLLLLLTALLRPNMAASGTGRSLSHPSGSFGVSRIAYDWVDASRPETAINDPNAHLADGKQQVTLVAGMTVLTFALDGK